MAELFGFSITRQKKTTDPKQGFTQPQADDGTQTIAAGIIHSLFSLGDGNIVWMCMIKTNIMFNRYLLFV